MESFVYIYLFPTVKLTCKYKSNIFICFISYLK